jgi:hypothetical protein
MALLDWILPVAATVGSSLYSANAQRDAANAQAQAAQGAGQQSLAQFYQTRQDLLPYSETGTQALFALSDLYGIPRPTGQGGYTTGRAFEGTPGYQFQMDEGLRAIDRSAASRGRLQSGATQRAAQRYGTGLASQEFNNYSNRIASLAGLGQTAGTAVGQIGQNAAADAGRSAVAAGQAMGSGYTGTAGALNQGIGNLLYWYGRR